MKHVSTIFNIQSDEGPIGISFLEKTAAEDYCGLRNNAIAEFYAIKNRIPSPVKKYGENHPSRPLLPFHLKKAMDTGTWGMGEETEWKAILSKWEKLCEKADKELEHQHNSDMIRYNALFMTEVNKIKSVKLRKAILALVSNSELMDYIYISEGKLYS